MVQERQRSANLTFMTSPRYFYTSESVSEGHPDKLCDQISDGVLDAILAKDPNSRVACEVATTTGLIVVIGEITTTAYVDIQAIVRDTVRRIGYTSGDIGFDADTCGVIVSIHEQSPDIKQGVDRAFVGTMRFPNGATGRVACSMLSRRLLSLRLVVTGTEGRLKAANPLMPKLRGSLTIESGEGKRRERPWSGTTYDHQLAAFVAAVNDGAPPLTGIDDAVANMAVIDAFYEAVGMEPREPTP